MNEAIKALLVAVEYGGLVDLPNGAGKGYMARIPEQFVIDLLSHFDAKPEASVDHIGEATEMVASAERMGRWKVLSREDFGLKVVKIARDNWPPIGVYEGVVAMLTRYVDAAYAVYKHSLTPGELSGGEGE